MGKYVVLNFEDKQGSTDRGAADSTVNALKKRYETDRAPKGFKKLFLSGNTVVEHRCVEVDKKMIKFTDDGARLAQIRVDCSQAEKIYIVAHGDPRTTDICYTNDPDGVGVVRLANYSELAKFLRQVILPRKGVIRISLIMCYGARCRDYVRANVNHMGMIDSEDLATSFAYQLFRKLVKTLQVRLTAVTGKITHDAHSGHGLVEIEDMIDENMEFAEAAGAQTTSKGDLNRQYSLLAQQGKSSEITETLKRFRLNPKSAAVSDVEKYVKAYLEWEESGGLAMMQRVSNAKLAKQTAMSNATRQGLEEMMPKYGKFIYTYKNSVLKIVNKYGAPGSTAIRPMKVLYEGPLL